MADSASPSDLLERYGSLERAYCDERWSSVVKDGQTLLSALVDAADAPEGLKERLQLLMAHAYLYGFGDRDNAEDLYQAVLRSGGEASLRQIAEQGLQQCIRPIAAPAASAVVEDLPQAAQPEPQASLVEPPQPQPVVATPQPPSEPPSSPSAPSASQDSSELSWLGEGASSQPATSPEATPVMPWLSSSSPAESGVQAVAAAASPFMEPAATTVASQADVAGPPAAAGSGVDGSPAAEAPLQQSWLAAPEERPAAAVDLFAPGEPPATPEVVAASLPEAATAVAQASAASEERLVPEVVEEPELIEVHQADPLLAEEVELSVRESLPPAAEPLQLQPVVPAAAVDQQVEEARLSLVKPAVVATPAAGDAAADSSLDGVTAVGSGSEAGEFLAAGSGFQELESADTLRIPVAFGAGPFSGPPEPVAEEDPELLLGLLRVEMG